MKEEKKKSKLIIITAVILLLLIATVTGVAYAMFSTSLTGTKENTISTGYVTMSCSETSFNITDTQVLTDAQGIAATNNAATCTLTTTMNGTMTLGYDVALTDVDADAPSDAIGEGNIKIQASKTISGNTTYLAGSSASAGVLVSSIASAAGQYDSSITGYKIDSATTAANESIQYTVKAWVASIGAGNGSDMSNSSATGVCTDTTYTTKEACETAGGVWGNSQQVTQSGGNFSFKLKVGATQVVN